MDILRVGTLGCARITPQALLPGKEEWGSSGRHRGKRLYRAQKFAQRHGISGVFTDYASLIQTQRSMRYTILYQIFHAEWSIRAMRAGKHVLCEKPMASNATEAERMKSSQKKKVKFNGGVSLAVPSLG